MSRLFVDEVLKDWTALTPTITYDSNGIPSESYVTFDVISSLNAMQTTNKARERKVITVGAVRLIRTVPT